MLVSGVIGGKEASGFLLHVNVRIDNNLEVVQRLGSPL